MPQVMQILLCSRQLSLLCTNNTVLVGDDTDLIVLLCYHASLKSCDLYFCPEPKKNTKKPRIWNIIATKQILGEDICNHILFIHALLGCDTTSLERELLFKNSKQVAHSVSRLWYLTNVLLLNMML